MRPEVEDRGRAPFDVVLGEMRALHAAVHRGVSDGRILMVEHDPVYTAGRATPPTEIGPHVVAIERGGKVTYHGPGQLVVYPVLRLPRRDVRDWLRRLEAFGVRVAARFGLAATTSVDGTGVFVGARKFASIGVAVKHWINLHGIAINVAMDPAVWRSVRPCGLSPDVMTDLSTAAGRPIPMDAVRAAVRDAVSLLVTDGDPL